MEPDEKKALSLLQQIQAISRDKDAKRKEAKQARKVERAKKLAKCVVASLYLTRPVADNLLLSGRTRSGASARRRRSRSSSRRRVGQRSARPRAGALPTRSGSASRCRRLVRMESTAIHRVSRLAGDSRERTAWRVSLCWQSNLSPAHFTDCAAQDALHSNLHR